MIRTYLDWLLVGAVGRSAPRSGSTRSTRARCSTPTTPASTTSRSASSSTSPCASSAQERGIPNDKRSRRDPDPHRPARHRQDLDRRVGRPGAEPRVRAHVARRHPRRGGDPRPPPHLHRRAPGPARARAARRGDDEPGDPARRGRQGRRRLARRPVARRCSRCSTRRRTTRSATTTSTSSSTSPRCSSSRPRNIADTIPGPLLDRMEVIRFDGYTDDEKTAIARGYLWPRQRERNGLREDEVAIADDVLRTVVAEYTREAGVRQLERELGKILRKTATKIASGTVEAAGRQSTSTSSATRSAGRRFFQEVGRAHGGAGRRDRASPSPAPAATCSSSRRPRWTAATSSLLTGQLGDVMKESARIALSYVRSHAEELGIDPKCVRRPLVPRARAGGRDPEGRPERRHHDGDRARVAAHRPPGQAHGRHDRRGHAAGPRAADRRAQAEGARGPRRRADRRDHPGAEPRPTSTTSRRTSARR